MQEPATSNLRLKQLREQQGLTQEELADLIGKSVHTIHSWELGRRRPDPGVLSAYAQALGFVPGTGEFHTFVGHVRGFAQPQPLAVPMPTPPEPTQAVAAWNTPEQRARAKVLREVREVWVEGVLQSSLHGQALIELGLAKRTDLVRQVWHDIFPWELRPEPAPPHSDQPTNSRLIDVFDAHQAELLILGSPGAGKTTMLIDLVATLIDRAEADPLHPLPVLFNLASWVEQRLPLADWLVSELSERHGIAPRISRQWLADESILPLLDGLDEVFHADRASCVRAINTFHQHYATGLAVTSRIADYDTLSEQLRIRSAVVLQPLVDSQIHAYVAQFGVRLAQLVITLAEDTQLRELARLPLLLSMMVIVYQDAEISTIPQAVSLLQQRRELFDRYIEHVFVTRRRTVRTYSIEQTREWLAWLALQMTAHGQTIFYPDHLQADWLPTRASQVGFVILDRLAGAIIGAGFLMLGYLALILGYGAITQASPVYYYALGRDTAVIALIGGLIGGLFGGSSSLHQERRARRENLTGWMLGGGYFGVIGWFNTSEIRSALAFAIIGSAIGLFSGWPRLQPRQITPVAPRRWSWQRTRHLLTFALPGGLVVGALVSLFLKPDGLLERIFAFNPPLGTLAFSVVAMITCSFAFGFSRAELNEQMVRPNQSIDHSLQSLGWSMLAGGVPVIFLFGLMVKIPATALVIGLFGALIGGASFGGFAALSHYTLRFALWRSGVVPWRLPSFLHLCAERILLQRIGGGYRFPHKLLQEHFVERVPLWLAPGRQVGSTTRLHTPWWAEVCGILVIAVVAATLLAANPRIPIVDVPAGQANVALFSSQATTEAQRIVAGSTVHVTAWGSFPVSPFTGLVGPNGTERGFLGVPLGKKDKVLNEYPVGALLCRIEGEATWRFCGEQASFVAPHTGKLEFAINHCYALQKTWRFVVAVTLDAQVRAK